jgi:hypothetical protein
MSNTQLEDLPQCTHSGVTVPGWSERPNKRGTCIAPKGQKCCNESTYNGQPVCEAQFRNHNYDERAMNNWISSCIEPAKVKDLLEKKCPLSISQTRDGNVYINQTNSALRDKYLFSGCTDSNTCNTTNMDPISKNILDSIPSKGHCGAWDLGDYGWNQDKGKWVNKIDYNYIKNEINNQKSIINETSDQIEKKAEALEEKQKQVYGQTKEIEDKMRLLETRDKMRELSIDRNLYKNKVIYSLFSVVLAFVIIMIGLYALFNKKLNIGE